jgi:hypothetical protein
MSRARGIMRGMIGALMLSATAAGPALARAGDADAPVQAVRFLALRCVALPAALNLDPGMGRLAFEPGRWDEPAEGSPTVPRFAFSLPEPDEDPVCTGEPMRQAEGTAAGAPGGAIESQGRDMSGTGISATGR